MCSAMLQQARKTIAKNTILQTHLKEDIVPQAAL